MSQQNLPAAPSGYSELPPPPPGFSDITEDIKEAELLTSREQMTHNPTLNRRDPGIDYKRGIRSSKFRAGFSRMDNPEEKSNYLNQIVGKDNWGIDSFGAYFIRPEGGKRIGEDLTARTAIDEQTLSFNDVSDLAGSAPAIGGAVGFGMAATGLGVLPGMGMAALGAATGTSADEIIKNIQGWQRKSGFDVLKEQTGEAALAATGEGAFRIARGVGKYVLGPGSSKMTPAKQKAMEETLDLGFKIKPGQITQGKLLGRWEGMVQNIFGDLNAPSNAAVAMRHYQALMAKASAEVRATGEISSELASAIKLSRKAFGNKAEQLYGIVDDITGGKPIVPTSNFKTALDDLVDEMPKNSNGEPIFTSPELQAAFKRYSDIAELQTTKASQLLRTTFREAGEQKDLIPGIDKRQSGILERAVDADIQAAKGPPEAIKALRDADKYWKDGISKYDDFVLSTITRPTNKRGSVDPELILDHVIKPKLASRVARVRRVVPEQTWDLVKRGEAERILGKAVRRSDNPLEGDVFDGVALQKELDRLGKDVLDEVFGKNWTTQAFKLAQAMRIAESRMAMSGGIVAANIALHPVGKLPTLLWLRGVATLLQQPRMLKYMTTGFQIPKTRAGAEALTRISTQMLLLSEDKTGSSAATLSPPPQLQPESTEQPVEQPTKRQFTPAFDLAQ